MSGQEANINLIEENSSSLLVTATTLLIISWITVFLRSYTRAILIKSFQIDDWFMLGAQIVFTALCAFIIQGVKVGLGRHNKVITSQDDLVEALMWQALAAAGYVLDMALVKLSVGFFLLRLATRKIYIWIIRINLVFIVIWSTVLFFWDLFQCHPITKQWDPRIQEGSCVAPSQVVQAVYAYSAMCVLSDWIFALLPIPMLWKVVMTKQAKAVVIIILGLGVFASIATLIRLKYLADIEKIDDLLFSGTSVMVWTLIEPGIAIIAASMATIRPLLRRLRIHGFESADVLIFYDDGSDGNYRCRAKARAGSVRLTNLNPQNLKTNGLEMNEISQGRVKAPAHDISLTALDKSLPAVPELNNRLGTVSNELFRHR